MFTILSVGKLKENWRVLAEEYLKRLDPFLPVRVVEIPETAFSKNDPVEKVTADEARRLIKLLKPDAHVVALEPAAKPQTTDAFFEKLKIWRRKSEIIFVIGGPLGLHESVRTRADELLSLSPLTFTHQMTRVILLEQIYRCVMKEKGKYDY